MSKTLRNLDDLTGTYDISKNTKIVDERDQTLSHFILKVNDKDTSFIINIDGQAKYKMSIVEMYEDGLTRKMKWFPWLQTYDDTNDIYVVVFEPEEPVKFKHLSIILVPSKVMSYSYTAGFVEEVFNQEELTAETQRILEAQTRQIATGIQNTLNRQLEHLIIEPTKPVSTEPVNTPENITTADVIADIHRLFREETEHIKKYLESLTAERG